MRQMMMIVGVLALVAAAATVDARDEKAAPKEAAKPAPAHPSYDITCKK